MIIRTENDSHNNNSAHGKCEYPYYSLCVYLFVVLKLKKELISCNCDFFRPIVCGVRSIQVSRQMLLHQCRLATTTLNLFLLICMRAADRDRRRPTHTQTQTHRPEREADTLTFKTINEHVNKNSSEKYLQL